MPRKHRHHDRDRDRDHDSSYRDSSLGRRTHSESHDYEQNSPHDRYQRSDSKRDLGQMSAYGSPHGISHYPNYYSQNVNPQDWYDDNNVLHHISQDSNPPLGEKDYVNPIKPYIRSDSGTSRQTSSSKDSNHNDKHSYPRDHYQRSDSKRDLLQQGTDVTSRQSSHDPTTRHHRHRHHHRRDTSQDRFQRSDSKRDLRQEMSDSTRDLRQQRSDSKRDLKQQMSDSKRDRKHSDNGTMRQTSHDSNHRSSASRGGEDVAPGRRRTSSSSSDKNKSRSSKRDKNPETSEAMGSSADVSKRRSSKRDKHAKAGDKERGESTPPIASPSASKPPAPPIELLSPKQNGSTGVEADGKNKASIKGMWKKAFKSLKSKDKEKDEKSEKSEKGEGKYSRLQRGTSFLGFGQSRSSTKSQKSKESQDSHDSMSSSSAQSPEVVQGSDTQSHKEGFLRRHTKPARAPKTPEADYSRQSSLKRVLKRKDSKEASSDGEPNPEGAIGGDGASEGGNMDPVFSTLRQAMSMRKPLSGSEVDESLLEEPDEFFDMATSPEVFPTTTTDPALSHHYHQHHHHEPPYYDQH